LLAGLAGVFLTAYYTFRLIFLILCPQQPAEPVADAHGSHSTSALMNLPLIVLAGLTVVLGLAQHRLEGFLLEPAADHPGHPLWLAPLSIAIALAGVWLAWLEFGRKGAPRIGFVERWPALAQLFAQRWYLDHFYRRCLDGIVYQGLSRRCAGNDDKIIDGGIHALGHGIVAGGNWLARRHLGLIQPKLMVVLAVIFYLMLTILV